MGRTARQIALTLLVLSLGVAVAVLAYLHFSASGEGDLSGEWSAQLDMTEQAAVTALDWLQDIEAVSVSLEDMESYMRGLTVQVNFELVQTRRSREASQGTFRCYVLPESYEACRRAAYEAFAAAFRELVAQRLRMTDYAGGTDGEDVEALVAQTFGMSTVSYLMAYGPALLPSLEELQAAHEGSGTYEAAEGVLTRRFEDGGAESVKTESYIQEGDRLLLLGEEGSDAYPSFFDVYPIVFTLQDAE